MSEPNLFEVGYQMQKEEQQETIKINSLELENVKRVKAVKLEPTASGLTVVGGKNNQGKTSVLDAITWALGGEKYKPSQPDREGSMIPPKLHIELSNGIIVERSGKNSALKVLDSTGAKGGQKLLDSFISTFALDLPKFIFTLIEYICRSHLKGVYKIQKDTPSRRRPLYKIGEDYII